MMKSRTAMLCVGAFICAATVFCGCDKGPSLSEIEEKERNSRLYTNAMDDLQAGRMDAAIKGFERVVLQEPKSYSAHFQLATLLQDVRKDYISAIAHYRDYLQLRPASDKATVAQDRMKLCETLLSSEILRRAGGSASNKLAADNEKLTGERTELAAQVKKLEGELARARKEIARLETENASKHRLLAKLSASLESDPAARGTAIKEALATLKLDDENIERRKINPTDAELLDDDAPTVADRARTAADLRQAKDAFAKQDGATSGKAGTVDRKALADAKALADDADSVQRPPTEAPAATLKGKTPALDSMLGGRRAKPAPGGGTRPDTYVVQDGDTLYKISTRFYGSKNMWRSIQNVNRATIPMDGRLRPGQVIKLP